MKHKKIDYGKVTINYMTGNEQGYAVDGILLTGLQLPVAALLQASVTGIRIDASGVITALDTPTPGVIIFGNFKGDRPALVV